MKRYDLFSGLFLMLLSIGTCILAYQLGLGRIGHPGTGLIPFGTAALLCLMSVGLVLKSLIKKEKGDQKSGNFRGIQWRTLIMVVCALIGYGMFFGSLGFSVTTFFLVFLLLWRIGRQRWWMTLAISILIVIGVNLIFVVWLGCQFPKGFLGV